MSCSDQTFKDLPIIALNSQQTNYQDIIKDSITISQGLFFRQLKERRFQKIFGHAHFIYQEMKKGKQVYDLILLSAQLDDREIRLLCSIDPDFYSVIDVVTYQPDEHKLIAIERSKMGSTFTDIKLLSTADDNLRQDTMLIQANDAGLFEQIPFCCDF